MIIVDTIKDLLGKLSTQNFTELPNPIRTGLLKYLDNGESVVSNIRLNRAIYRAPRWMDSNTFYNSWFVLTEKRIVVARNSSGFKRFRDIPLAGITQTFYEIDRNEPRISITSPGTEDILEFLRTGAHLCADIEGILENTIDKAKENYRESDANYVHCNKCGSKILKDSNFCAECGTKQPLS